MTLPDQKFRDGELARKMLVRLHEDLRGSEQVRLMEVCGTHTVAIGRSGLRKSLPPELTLLSGPGCPVCVTPGAYVDKAASLALSGVTVVTFGDMVRVPGDETSLELARAQGGRIAVAASINNALDIARDSHGEVVFLAVGFETTSPSIAAGIVAAKAAGLKNFSVLAAHKLVPPALRFLLDDAGSRVSGFILPGHVSVITGTEPYEFLAREFGVPGVVAGFEPLDLLSAISSLAKMAREKRPAIVNGYTRAVRPEGNPAARAMMEKVFDVADASWRGIGVIEKSGLVIRDSFADFDAEKRFGAVAVNNVMPDGCACGKVLRGQARPADCLLFGVVCSPEKPAGPCMVSSEGACGVSYKYGER